VPDLVVVSVGDGNIISGVWKGFAELARLGFIDKTPKLLAVQAEGSAAVVRPDGDGKIRPVSGDTIARLDLGEPAARRRRRGAGDQGGERFRHHRA